MARPFIDQTSQTIAPFLRAVKNFFLFFSMYIFSNCTSSDTYSIAVDYSCLVKRDIFKVI